MNLAAVTFREEISQWEKRQMSRTSSGGVRAWRFGILGVVLRTDAEIRTLELSEPAAGPANAGSQAFAVFHNHSYA